MNNDMCQINTFKKWGGGGGSDWNLNTVLFKRWMTKLS